MFTDHSFFKNLPFVVSSQRCQLPSILFSSAMVVAVSMEMCVQNLYPWRSPELPGNSRKALVELRATKERLRCKSFPIPLSFARRSTNPFFRHRFCTSHGPGPCIPVCRCRKTKKRISPRKCRGDNGYIHACVSTTVQNDARHPVTTLADIHFVF